MESFNINISTSDIEVIGAALGGLPYNQAKPVINRLQDSINISNELKNVDTTSPITGADTDEAEENEYNEITD